MRELRDTKPNPSIIMYLVKDRTKKILILSYFSLLSSIFSSIKSLEQKKGFRTNCVSLGNLLSMPQFLQMSLFPKLHKNIEH